MSARNLPIVLVIFAVIGILTACGNSTPTPASTTSAQTDEQGGDVSPAIVVTGAWIRPVVVVADEPESTGETDDEAPLSNAPRGERATQVPVLSDSVTALYMVIENRRPEDDALIGVTIAPDVATMAMIHQTIVENDVARMQETPSLTVLANGSVSLEPGGYHVMLMGVQRDLTVGESVQVMLVFQSGRTVEVTAIVQESAP